MTSDLWTLCFVVGAWIFIGCVLVPLVLLLVTVYERHVGPVGDMLLPRAERAFPPSVVTSVVTADAEETVALEAELACRSCDLEGAWVWPCAPNPKLLFVSGDLERRLDAQRKRDRRDS